MSDMSSLCIVDTAVALINNVLHIMHISYAVFVTSYFCTLICKNMSLSIQSGVWAILVQVKFST